MSRSKKNSNVQPPPPPVITEVGEEEEGGEDDKKQGVSGFISKIYKMVSDPQTQDIVSWNERGDGFAVKNEFVFASQIMRTYFRHQNFSSFVRQLNFYGFHKDAGLRDLVTNLTSEVAELRQQNEDLFKIQQRILYIFSRYMRATNGGQVGPGGGSASQPSPQQVDAAGNKRIRGNRVDEAMTVNNKRQKLLMESKPDSPSDPSDGSYNGPPQSSSSRSQGDYYSAAASGQSGPASSRNSYEGNVVDLNTDSYHQHNSGGYGSNSVDNLYGNHALSDLNWSSDPQLVSDLIGKSVPLQQVLNSSNTLPMQMGRPAPNQAMMNMGGGGHTFLMDGGYGYGGSGDYGSSNVSGNNMQLLNSRVGSRPRGGMSGGGVTSSSSGRNVSSVANMNGPDLLSLGSQLANTNPKQLLELLDRMGGDVANMDTAVTTSLNRARSGVAGAGMTGVRKVEPASSSAAYANALTGGNENISGVFEDMEEDVSRAPVRGGGKRAPSNGSNTAGMPLSSSSSGAYTIPLLQPYDPAYVPPPRTGGATLSPLDDEPTFALKQSTSPTLTALPIPSSPVSPFIPDVAQMDNFPMPNATMNPSNFGSAFELRSPSLQRDTSITIPTNADPMAFAINSPYHNTLDMQPLTPNNM